MIVVKRIENNPIKSNCYIIHIIGERYAIIIDPGSYELTPIENYIKDNCLIPELIILTHEHFDHIWGVEQLRSTYGCKLVASNECSDAIVEPKKNLSLFYDQVGVYCSKADIVFTEELHTVLWHDLIIELYKTPGHSKGSICILLGRFLFTGDSLLKNDKTITKLPGGNKDQLNESIKLIYSLQHMFDKIFPGHNEEFILEESNLNQLV
ncbi:MAG TPA: MBL fold metallo-hydrolase [Hanamia sp.]